MVDLAEAGRHLASWDAGEPTDPTILQRRARSRTRRRRVSLGVTAAAIAGATAVLVALVIPAGSDSTKVEVGPASLPSYPAVPPPPAPPGWYRDYLGAIEVAAPPGGIVAASTGSQNAAVVCIVNRCTTTDSPSTDNPVVLTDLSSPATGTPQVINGLVVYVSTNGLFGRYEIPSLSLQMLTYGALGRRIAATASPSTALVVASATSAPSVPTTWKTERYGAVSVSVPPTWPVIRLTALPRQAPPAGAKADQMGCELFPDPLLYLGDPPGSCDGSTSSKGWASGMWLGQSAITSDQDLTRTRLQWVTGVDVEIGWSRIGVSYLADLTIKTPHGTVHGTVGLGSDPATIETVLGSIHVDK